MELGFVVWRTDLNPKDVVLISNRFGSCHKMNRVERWDLMSQKKKAKASDIYRKQSSVLGSRSDPIKHRTPGVLGMAYG